MTVLNVLTADRYGLLGLGGQIDPALTYPAVARPRPVPAATESGPGGDPTVRRLIAAHPALGLLAEKDRTALLRGAKIRVAERQEVVCYQDDPAAHLILVLDGYLKLSATLSNGSEVFVEVAGPGHCVGEILTLQSRAHDSSATALSVCRLLMIDARQFRHAFDDKPEGLRALLRLADGRIQATVERLLDSRARTAPVRLAKALAEVACLSRSAAPKGGCMPLRLSQGELGVMAGMSREMVNKHLALWRDAGWVRMACGTVAWIDVEALSAMSSEPTAH
jgi:CRP/FNR family cyclic AMP-dependent transcriptional regulator